MKKFELTSEFITNVLGAKLFRIKALIEFGDVSAGELGGYIEKMCIRDRYHETRETLWEEAGTTPQG